MKYGYVMGIAGLAAMIGASGCLSVNGTVRVIHESATPGEASVAAAAAAPVAARPAPQAKVAAPAPAPMPVPTPAAKPVAPAQRKADQMELAATRDVRILHHSQERNQNGGRSNRLRVKNIERGSAEVALMDFDRTALRTFVKKYEGQNFSGKLILDVREVQKGPGNVEAAVLDAGADWNEGSGVQDKAKPGEVTASEAQAGRKPWTTWAGEEVALLKDLVYRDGEVVAVHNSAKVTVTGQQEGQKVELPLDEKFIRHLATSPNARGIVLFTQDATPVIDFFSRDQYGKGPVMVVETK